MFTPLPIGSSAIAESIIAFGSTDESVLYQHDLKSDPLNGLVKPTGHISDTNSEGMLLGTGGWMFDFSALGHTLLETSGQFSFTIPAVALGDLGSVDPTNIGATGEATVSTSYLATWGDDATTNPTVDGRIFTSSSKLIQIGLLSTSTASTMLLTDHVESGNIIFTVSWSGGTIRTYTNGVPYKEEAVKGATGTDFMKYFHIGTNWGAGTQNFEQVHRVKDFIISSRPVLAPVHPELVKIAFGGDSFANQSFVSPGQPTTGYQNVASLVARGYMLKRNIDINFAGHGIGGAYVHDWSGSLPVLFEDQIAGIISDNPNHTILQLGTNDAGHSSYVEATYKATYISHLTTLLAGTTGKFFIGTIPSRKGLGLGSYGDPTPAAEDTDDRARVASINVVNASLPAAMAAVNPLYAGRVIVYDLSAATGGESAADNLLAGLVWDGYDNGSTAEWTRDGHLSSLGRELFGNLLGKTLHDNLI